MSFDDLNALPTWLDTPVEPIRAPQRSPDRSSLEALQFEHAFDPIMDLIMEGYTLQNAIKDYPIPLERGRFIAWINKSSERRAQYKHAKEVRTEVWAGNMVGHATGEANPLEDVQRSKLVVDTYKWLMGADNRATYGETKTIDIGGTISITAALQEAKQRRESIALLPSTPVDGALEDVAEFVQVGYSPAQSGSDTDEE